MTENNLEGMDDLDSLLDEGGSEGGEESFAGELDDFLSDDAGDDMGAASGGEDSGGGDSELDSFFEDLSTIDDLEVIQDEESAAVAETAMAAAAPVAAAAVAAAALAPTAKKEKKEGKTGSGFFKKLFRLILLVGLGFGAYWGYSEFFSEKEKVPWQPVQDQVKIIKDYGEGKLKGLFEKSPEVVKPPPPQPEPQPRRVMAPPPPPPPPRAVVPPPPGAPAYGVQVATCFFSNCLEGFRGLLQQNRRSVYVRQRSSSSESLELLSTTVFSTKQNAVDFSERINREHRMEGQAYAKESPGGYRISMGTFPDLARANMVKDSLNQQFPGQISFSAQLRKVPLNLRRVISGRFATKSEAQRELRVLRRLDPRLRGSFVVRY